MLALDRPLGVVAGLALYGDHADPNRVYYAPTRPRVARVDGEAELSFVKFRGDDPLADGGTGLLSFTTELIATDEQLDEARQHVVQLGVSEPILGQFPWRAGKAVFAAALVEGDGFVEKMYGEVMPDLAGDNRAMFSLRLNEQGAQLVEALLEADGPSALGVRYELEYLGLRPALHVHIEADYSRIYDELSFGFEAGVAYQGVGVRAGVEKATKKLVENGAIRVEVMHFTDDGDLRKRVDEAVKWFQEKILEDMFETKLHNQGRQNAMDAAGAAAAALGTTLGEALANPELFDKLSKQTGIPPEVLKALTGMGGGPGGALGMGGGGVPGMGGAGEAAGGEAAGGQLPISLKLEFSFKDIHEEELRTISLDWNEARAEKRTAAPQGLLSDIGPEPNIVEADASGEFWDKLEVNVRPLGDFEKLGVDRMVVTLAHPDEKDADATRKALTFERGQPAPQKFAAWTGGKPPWYRMHSEVHFTDEGAWPGPPSHVGAWKDAQALELAVHPLTDVPRLELELSPGSVRFEQTPQVQIDVRVDGEVIATKMLTAEQPRAMVRQRLTIPEPTEEAEADASETATMGGEDGETTPTRTGPFVEARATWFLAEGGRTEGTWEQVEGSVLLVHAPWRSQRTVRVFPMLPPDFLDASVTLTLTEGSRTAVENVQLVPGQRGPQTVSLPSLSEQPPPVRVDVLVIRGDGSTFVAEGYDTTEPVVLVRDRDGEHRKVEVKLLAGARLADHGLIAVQVKLLDDADEELDAVVFTESQRDPGTLLVPVGEGGFQMRYQVVRYGLDAVAKPDEIQVNTRPQLLVPAVAPSR